MRASFRQQYEGVKRSIAAYGMLVRVGAFSAHDKGLLQQTYMHTCNAIYYDTEGHMRILRRLRLLYTLGATDWSARHCVS